MFIKNTDELRKRARWHREQDHIVQGRYGCGSVNGVASFEGCAVGCLSTPHQEKALRAFLQGVIGKAEFECMPLDVADGDIDDWQIGRLGEKFGICPVLARMAEGIFEDFDRDESELAAQFVVDFAYALKEGVFLDRDALTPIGELLFCDWDDDWPSETNRWIDGKYRHTEHLAEIFLEWLKEQQAPLTEEQQTLAVR